jgi:imidazolonepropionase-like amidohydrolase/Tol biopolymer transport system component
MLAVLLLACAPTGETMPPPTDTFDWARVGQADEPTKDDDDKDSWDVNAPPGPSFEATIDTDEGTWMSLDVSPDGKQIVFDLLGDIYVMPMSGGEARPLIEGMAWDMQPSYSPDGEWIVFTSDRAGGDNVWIMRSDGSDPKQVTKEDFRLLNSPTWSPDGQFIAARKHFTSRRSLGAGEIWLYHVSGGKGLQMTEKPNEQKDVGEPAFSPDGRYVYYSQDVTPGKSFEYNKNPHGQIYVIQRLDRKDGYTQRFVTGPGGSVRPTPSHDGKQLAFVRRVGTQTVLFVHDVESGAERPVYRGLDRDMQETWAIHGVYPTMAWTPDDKAIVVWAGGKIRKVDVVTGKEEVIPFHVKHTRKMIEAVRSPVEVHPAKFDTKMLRWVQVAPDGKSVVYQALGHIYVRGLPDGAPRRLTTDDEFELYPSFSRDGRQVVYVSWDDQSLGSVRVVSSKGGKPRTITNRPGHYVEPVFSPDGSKVVFRAVSAGWLRSPEWSHETGLFWVPTRGGADAERISRSGSAPHFGTDDDRVFFVDRKSDKDDHTVVLKSIELDGSDEITHLDTEHGTEFRVSPDGRWVAFREQFKAHVAPFPPTGRTVKLGPQSDTIPLATVTRDAGEYLHWAGDSQQLHWTVGPELFSRDLQQVFAFIEGAPEKLPEPARIGSGTNIGFSAEADLPSGKIALVGARIVTMKGDEVIEDGTILVDGNRIASVGPSGRVKPPDDAMVVDVKGNTIIPGLVDAHAHGSQGRNGIIPQQNWLHYATLTFGVTTIHDPSHHTATIFGAAELARAGMITAPRIFSTGTILYGAKGSIKAIVDNLDDARGHLRRMKAAGAISVKSYNQPRRDQRQQILTAARELDMMVVPEGGSLYQHNMTMVVDGHTGIEHSIPIARGYKDMIQLWSATKVAYTPTIVVGYGGVWGDNYWYQHTNVYENERLRTFAPPRAFVPRSRRRMHVSDDDWNHIDIARLCKQLSDAGVMINLGAHGQREGLGMHWELWMLVQGGMTPLEALRTGTLNSARYLGLDGDMGSLEPGKLADLVVIAGNPLDDIRVSEKVRYTMINGRLFDAATMHQIGNHPEKRKPFYWER